MKTKWFFWEKPDKPSSLSTPRHHSSYVSSSPEARPWLPSSDSLDGRLSLVSLLLGDLLLLVDYASFGMGLASLRGDAIALALSRSGNVEGDIGTSVTFMK